MLKKRNLLAASSLNGYIYAVGGNEVSNTMNGIARHDTCERFDPRKNQWTMISSISRPREAIAMASLGSSSLFIAGGYDGLKFLDECEKYDPIKNEWTKVHLLFFNSFQFKKSLSIYIKF